jgi:hypothetical protein
MFVKISLVNSKSLNPITMSKKINKAKPRGPEKPLGFTATIKIRKSRVRKHVYKMLVMRYETSKRYL